MAKKQLDTTKINTLIKVVTTSMEESLANWENLIIETHVNAFEKYETWVAPIPLPVIHGTKDDGYMSQYLSKELKLNQYKDKNHILVPFWYYGRMTREQLMKSATHTAKENTAAAREKIALNLTKKFSEIDGMAVKASCHYLSAKAGELQGTWYVTMDNGDQYSITAQVIYAGGYNIQRFHARYLFKVTRISRP